ncbi:MAG: DNA mismatch repair protein MutS [Promethearchaeota archaeon]
MMRMKLIDNSDGSNKSKMKDLKHMSWRDLNRRDLPEAMRHWYDIKSKYPDYIVAYRMGDFYEMFYDDARLVSKLLGLTLTTRGQGNNRHPLAGIPHKATQHFKNLIKHGQTVVIVEQLEDPKDVSGRIVKRGVVQILSPGTVIDSSLLDTNSNNYLVSIYKGKKVFGVAFIDVSCGEFICSEAKITEDQNELISLIAKFDPVECILPTSLYENNEFVNILKENFKFIIKEMPNYSFELNNARNLLLRQFKVQNLEGFGINKMNAAICAAGALLDFLNTTQNTVLANITAIKKYYANDYMFLDYNTIKNLELLKNLQDGSEYGSLFSIINYTKTPMGNRLLRRLLTQPLLNKDEIEERLEIVELFRDNNLLRSELNEILNDMGDLERVISRINFSRSANARDLIFLKNSLRLLPEIKKLLKEASEEIKPLKDLVDSINDYTDITELIEIAIKDDPPTTITEGNIIKDGYDSRVDEMRDILKNGKNWILKYEEAEKRKLGLSSGYKIGFNRVLGYFIQITENALKGITLPKNYIKRQTLKGSVRFETNELKEIEVKILNADETIKNIEYEIFLKIREVVTKRTKSIQNDAERISKLDIFTSMGEVAARNNYTKPQISTHDKIIIKQGRHPVIEQINFNEAFIPNDCHMDTEKDQILLITGPNWSGKSTYLRQVALIVILAQIGSFVPAESADIGIVDRIFTRIGASDDLTRGQSTFMMEMTETAQILYYMTKRSLVIIDELGRGTSTSDGEAIARAVLEYLHKNRVKTLFSTHFHQLIDLKLERLKNYHFLIKEEGKKLIFLRRLTAGGTDKSYGIHVAMMAGIPEEVVNRAFELVDIDYQLTPSNNNINNKNITKEDNTSVQKQEQNKIYSTRPKRTKKKTPTLQTYLYIPTQKDTEQEPKPSSAEYQIIKELKDLNLEKITPLEAMKYLIKLKEKLNSK